MLRPVCDLANPAWTPDGRLVVTLAQGRERSDPATEETWIQQSAVELLDLDNGRQQTIVERRDWTGDAHAPAVSADGRTVIYTRLNSWRSKPAGQQAIFAVNFDGSEQRRLTPWELDGGDHPVFSPDGTILFRSYEHDEAKQSDYWTVHPNGKDLTQLTHNKQGTLVLSTSYSPDGKWIVHATNGVEGNADVLCDARRRHRQHARNTLQAVGQRSGLGTRALLKLRIPSRAHRRSGSLCAIPRWCRATSASLA